MELALPRCSLVLVGSWNVAIFTPEWIKSRLPTAGEVSIVLAAGLGITTTIAGHASLLVTSGQLQVQPLAREGSAFEEIERVACALLAALPETPVTALGVNIAYDVGDPGSVLGPALRLGVGETFGEGTIVHITGARRTLRIAGDIVNITAERDQSGSPVKLDFNHHFDLGPPSAREALDRLDKRVGLCRRRSEELALAAYQLRPQ